MYTARHSFETLSLQFSPLAQGIRSETLTLSCPALGKTLTISLKGEGVSPVLKVTPAGVPGLTTALEPASITTIDAWSTTGAPCRHVASGDRATSTVTLQNSSVFPLSYKILPILDSASNYNGKLPFTITPCEATIQPAESIDLTVAFQPDHERLWSYTYEASIAVPNQVEDHVVRLKGRCWESQAYVCAKKDSKAVTDEEERVREGMEDTFCLPTSLAAVDSKVKDDMGVKEPSRPDVEVTFPKEGESSEEGEDARAVTIGEERPRRKLANTVPNSLTPYASLVAGCIALVDAKLGGNISFSVAPVDPTADAAKLFTASPASGSVAPGNEQDVTFSFERPTVEEEGGIEVGQWTYVDFEVKASGGWGKGERVWRVRVKGYIKV